MVTRVRPPICIRRPDRKVITIGNEDTFYLGDDGRLIRVQTFERVLGFPPVRLEVKF